MINQAWGIQKTVEIRKNREVSHAKESLFMIHKADIQKTKKVRIFKNLKSHWLNAKGQNHVHKTILSQMHNFNKKLSIFHENKRFWL